MPGSLGGRVAALVGLVVAVPVLLAGCGGQARHRAWDPARTPNGVAEMTPEDAMLAARDAMLELESATYAGKAVLDYRTGKRPVDLRVVLTAVDHCEWTFTSEDAGTTVVRVIRGKQYWRPDDTALRVGWGYTSAQRRYVDGRWLLWEVPNASGPTLCATTETLPPFETWEEYHPTFGSDVDGTPTRALTRALTRPFSRWAHTLHIATVGEPLVLRISSRDADGPWNLTLRETDADVEIEAPPEVDVLDLADRTPAGPSVGA